MSSQNLFSRKAAELRSWMGAMAHRHRLESEMESELQYHLEALTADLIRAGHSPAEAARRARIALGPALVHKEGMRASLGLRWFDELFVDLRYAARMLRKNPGFTMIAAVSLALAIGANTTIFSIAKRLLLDRLDVPQPEQLRLLHWSGDQHVVVQNMWGLSDNLRGGGIVAASFSFPAYEQLRRDNRAFEDLFAFKDAGLLNATVDGSARIVQGELVSGNLFQQLRVTPQLGRLIQPTDDVQGAAPVLVVSDAFWRRVLSSSSSIVGRTIKVNMVTTTIIGVAPQGFTGVRSVQSAPDFFLPVSMQPLVAPRGKSGSLLGASDPGMWWLNIMGRLREGDTDQQAQAALDHSLTAAVYATMKPAAGETMPHLSIGDGSRGLFQSKEMFAKPMSILMTLVALVFLLACANIASLLLARSASRQREISVRLALGATRSRILRQVLTESILTASLGGVLGLIVAIPGRNMLLALTSNPWEESRFAAEFDWKVFLFTAIVTMAAGLLFGIMPAFGATRTEVSPSLKETAQTSTRRRKGWGGKAIVGFQVMLSTILIAGAFLFIRSLHNIGHVDPGFRSDHLLLFAIRQPESRYPPPTDIDLFARVEERLRAVPGVEMVTLSEVPYISDSMENTNFLPEGEALDPTKDQTAFNNAVGAGFFRTMGIPILAGRDFDARDSATASKVAVLSASLAQRAFPGKNPIGRHFRAHFHSREGNAGYSIEVVGVCADTRYWSLKQDPVATLYEPYTQVENLDFGATFEVRTYLKAASLTPALRNAVQSIDPDLPLIDVRTQREQIDSTIQQERIFAVLTAGFGVLALALACVGIYGIMAYSVAQRTNEIGIRLALGAQPRQVRGMILRESTWLTSAGIIAGIAGALACTRLVQSMLYGVSANDPATLAIATAVLIAVAMAATWIPARRASSVQPMDALRHE